VYISMYIGAMKVCVTEFRRKGKRVVLQFLKGRGKPGPLCPNLETPYDLVFD